MVTISPKRLVATRLVSTGSSAVWAVVIFDFLGALAILPSSCWWQSPEKLK
jgi:hypothetical protein